MMAKSSLMSEIAKLVRDNDGSFAIMTSILVTVVFMAGSLAIDTTNGKRKFGKDHA